MGREAIGLTGMAQDAVIILGQQVRLARHDRRMTAAELGARSGVSARTVYAIERGSASVSIGNVVNVAVTAGVPLFGAEDATELARLRRFGREKLALIPTRVYPEKITVDTSF